MDLFDEFWTDDDFDESCSDDDDDEEEEIYCPRELDYWSIEAYQEKRGPPPVISFASKLNAFELRECVVSNFTSDPSDAVGPLHVHSWRRFWENKPNVIHNPHTISTEEWDAIGEYCFGLCECCMYTDMERVRSCMINILKYGHFN